MLFLAGMHFVLFTRTVAAVLFCRTIERSEIHRSMVAADIGIWVIASGVCNPRLSTPLGSSLLTPAVTFSASRCAGPEPSECLPWSALRIAALVPPPVVWGRDRRFYVFSLILLAASTGMYYNAKFDQPHPEPLTQLWPLVIYQLSAAPKGRYVVGTRWVISSITITLSTNIFCAHLFLFSSLVDQGTIYL